MACSVIYKDFKVGEGSSPVDGQEVVFDYTGYNESASVIDSSYRKGQPASTRLGINGLIPGAAGIRSIYWGVERPSDERACQGRASQIAQSAAAHVLCFTGHVHAWYHYIGAYR